MTGYYAIVEMQEGELKEIMDRLDRAQEEIYSCYSELQRLGVLTFVKNDAGVETGVREG